MTGSSARVAAIAVLLATTTTAGRAKSLDALVSAAKAEGSVMIYHTTRCVRSDRCLWRSRTNMDIAVRNFYATGTPLSVRFSSEVVSGIMQADVFYSSDTSIFQDYPKSFQVLNLETLPNYSTVPEALRLPSGLAVSSVQLSYSMFYNAKRVSEAERPRTWLDLADPKWKGADANDRAALVDVVSRPL